MIETAVISSLKQHTPTEIAVNTNYAAVAIVLASGHGAPEILLIRRSRHPKDPWSGQIGLPGGRHEPTDADLVTTAIRETVEETAIDLGLSELALPLDDQQGYAQGGKINLTVRPFVFILDNKPEVNMNHELDAYYWLPIPFFTDPCNHILFTPMESWPDRPGVCIEDASILWGMTYRIMTDFFSSSNIDTPFVGDYQRTR